MNRNEEYLLLMDEMENTPMQLEYTIKRAEARIISAQRKRLVFGIPISLIASLLIVFTVLVNCFPTFANACGKIPLIKELAQVVTFSPSLSTAIENEYVQPIGQQQSLNGITARIEYVIVDQKQLNVFYTINSGIYTAMEATPEIKALDGSVLEGYSISSGNHQTPNGKLNFMTVDFMKHNMPYRLRFTLKVYDNGSLTETVPVEKDSLLLQDNYKEPEYISIFTFNLNFDPHYTAQGEKIDVDKTFIIDNQTLTLKTAEIYPTHMRMEFSDIHGNTAWLKSLSFYVKNEKGQRFDKIKNGITAAGSIDSPMMKSHRLESSFFFKSKKLTLYITGVDWLDKEMQKIRLDLINVKAENLPQGVVFEKAVRSGNGWILTFSGKQYIKNTTYQIWSQDYYDEDGNEYTYNSWSDSYGQWDEKQQKYINTPDVFFVEIPLVDYPYDVVYMSPAFSRKVELGKPVKIKIK